MIKNKFGTYNFCCRKCNYSGKITDLKKVVVFNRNVWQCPECKLIIMVATNKN